MTKRPKSDFLDVMVTRGYLQDCTDLEGLDARLAAGVVPAYIGYDATAQSLHVGHLLNIMMLRWLQKTGHKPITLMGGGTTKVGDPSFRSDERPLLSPDQIGANIATIRGVFAKYLAYGDAPDRRDHARQRRVARRPQLPRRFLRDIGRHFSVNRMLSFESVKSRLDREQPLSFLEFNYMILQAYDFLELHRREGCLLQMGGSDQWGNIVNGIDLTRRVAGARGLRPDLAAPHHLRRPQDGQVRRAAPSGSTPRCSRPTTSGSSGATPPTPTSAASSSSTPSFRSTNATASAPSAAPRSTPRRSASPTR